MSSSPSTYWHSLILAQLGYSLASPLWHDEIRRVDLNPPLSYLLTRLSFDLFDVGMLQCRLPEIAGSR